MEKKGALSAGTKLLDKYTIEKTLGMGGFGITYLASTTVSMGSFEAKAFVAIKEHFISSLCGRETDSQKVTFSQPVSEQVEGFKRDFLSEAKRLQSCSEHKNIVKVNEVFEENNTAYYVMEYLEGTPLSDYVSERKCLSEKETAKVMMPILSAVNFLHKKRMTHLDIKPANIMVCKDRQGNLRPVLIDFGLAKHYDDSGSPTSTINGQGISHGYAPIEQYSGIATFQPRADIYALGATLLYCLTGQQPQKATEIEMDEVLRTDLKESSDAMRQVISTAMQPRPANRYESVGEMIEKLNDDENLHDEAYAHEGKEMPELESEPLTPMPQAPISHELPQQPSAMPHVSQPYQQPAPQQLYQQPYLHQPMPGPQQPMRQPMPRPQQPIQQPMRGPQQTVQQPMPGPRPMPGPQPMHGMQQPRPQQGFANQGPIYPMQQQPPKKSSSCLKVLVILLAVLGAFFLFCIIIAMFVE